jgi:thioredoxin 1
MTAQPSSPPPLLLVACLCAQWCGTCRDYRAAFTDLGTQMPGTRFLWVDVEDQADWVDPIEVEDFPTLLIASKGEALFFGAVTPQVETLRRLIQAHQTGNTPSPLTAPMTSPDINALVQRLWHQL